MERTDDVNHTIDHEAEAPHLKRKESNHSLEPDGCNVMESPALFISPENDWPEPLSSLSSPIMFMDTLESKHPKNESEPPLTDPSSMNDTRGVIEELTLENYKSTNLSAVGCSKNREEMTPRKQQWQHLYQLAGRPQNASSHGEDEGKILKPDFRIQNSLLDKHPGPDRNEDSELLINSGKNCRVSSNTFVRSTEGIQTKVLPAFGFPHFLVKNTLKGKGVMYRHSDTRNRSGVMIRAQNNGKAPSDTPQNSNAKADDKMLCTGAEVRIDSFCDGVNLRKWLKSGRRKVNKVESMHIFKQILELVDLAHSQGIALRDIKPSYFMILPSNRVKYLGSLGSQIQIEFSKMNQDTHYSEPHLRRQRNSEQDMHNSTILSAKQQKLEHMEFVGQHHRLSPGCVLKDEFFKEVNVNRYKAQTFGFNFNEQNTEKELKTRNKSGSTIVSNNSLQQLIPEIIQLEERWYTSPEEANDRVCSLSSNIYSLGVLLFELYCFFESWEVQAAAMSDLRLRIFPPKFLSENFKEAGFCQWMLHPEPSSRPKTREIFQSELIYDPRDLSGEQLLLSIDEEDAEAELLLHFLISLNEQRQKQASKLVEDIDCFKMDIEETEKRLSLRTNFVSQTNKALKARDSLTDFDDILGECSHKGPLRSEVLSRLPPSMKKLGLIQNISQLENAYFSTRSKIRPPETDKAERSDIDVLMNPDKWPQKQDGNEWLKNEEPTDRLGAFFEGLCKYARYSKFEVRGILRNGDLLNSANVICSLSFDRDEDYFAAAGVSKKIKIFEFGSFLNNTVDIHYPVIEMSNESKISCVCWNNYIKNYLASTDYDGVVQLWDASTGQGFSQFVEHRKRAWSVDFSQVDPTKLASGSDDCSVKLWSINEERSLDTIRNVANVCCVQFSSYSTHLLAFGSADYKICCFDLRNTRVPWCILAGHGKAVSFVKFLDSNTLVSASTDNTLKLWDLNKTSSTGLSTTACSLTLSGHSNEKNFVGLSVSKGYIVCGSETNEVYAYYRSLPMPITSHKFGSIDPISGKETGDDNGLFVSSVCWRGKSDTVVAANSTGSIKLLQMI